MSVCLGTYANGSDRVLFVNFGHRSHTIIAYLLINLFFSISFFLPFLYRDNDRQETEREKGRERTRELCDDTNTINCVRVRVLVDIVLIAIMNKISSRILVIFRLFFLLLFLWTWMVGWRAFSFRNCRQFGAHNPMHTHTRTYQSFYMLHSLSDSISENGFLFRCLFSCFSCSCLLWSHWHEIDYRLGH